MAADPAAPRVESYKKRANTGGEVLVRVHEDVAAPAVVLFGWFGAKLKHVGKYASKWEDLGCSTVVCVAPTSVVFSLNHNNVPSFLLSVLSIIVADNRLLDGGLIIQFFSNGGAVCAPVLSKLFNGQLRDQVPIGSEFNINSIKKALCAIVFDSAPCYMHEHMAANAFAIGLGTSTNSWLATFLRLVFLLQVWLQRALYGDVATRFWKDIRNADYCAPELYMYSDSDPLADADRLQALVLERKAKFRDKIHELRVEDASHVRIMLRYPDQYMAALEGVLEWGVAEWRRKQGTDEKVEDDKCVENEKRGAAKL